MLYLVQVRHAGAEKGSKKANALWMDGEGGAGQWEWEVVAGEGVWLGVAEEERFGPGYKLKVGHCLQSKRCTP